MKYPIGIQTFKEIRQENYVYVDKTRSIYDLVSRGKIYFLSRPRRFGKSLLISTLKSLFEGEKELFKGLFIEDKIKWNRHIVIHFSLNHISNKETDLRIALNDMLRYHAQKYNVLLENGTLGGRFGELMQKLSKQGKVVLLIDEYDKPLISFLEDMETFEKNRNILKEFYGTIKDADAYVKFVLITGVSRFARVSVFSDLNNLKDISVDERYCDICGYSETDMHDYFTSRMEEIAKKMKITTEELFDKTKKKYDGYNFYGDTNMYNPWSVLNFLDTGKLQNYWFSTGTPTFLTGFAERMQTNIEGVIVTMAELESLNFEVEGLPILLYQTGYLTIDEEIEEDVLRLKHPNLEVAESFRLFLLGRFTHVLQGTIQNTLILLRKAMQTKDENGLMQAINPIFSNIPYHIFDKNHEAYYHSVMHLVFMMLHYKIQSEVSTNAGRIDSVVSMWNEIWIFEFKLNSSAQVAYNQIINNNYAEKYENDNKSIYGVGMNFDSEKKLITEVKLARLR